MTQIYQINSPVFIKVLNKKGIVKDYDSTLDQYYITYFNSKDKRESNWFTMNQLTEFKSKEIHARSSNGEKLVRFDIGEMVLPLSNQSNNIVKNKSDKFKEVNIWFNQWDNDGNSVNKYEQELLDQIIEIESSDKSESCKKLSILSIKEELMNYVKSGRPLFKGHKPNHINIIKPKVEDREAGLKGEELIKRVEKLLQEWDNLKPFKFKYDEQLEFPVTNNQYDSHIKSLEKLIEGYELVLSKNNTPLNIKIKYFSDVSPVEKIDKGNWIDLRSAIGIEIKQGERVMIPLGIGMKLPEGYEANVVPRSSTFKNWGIIQTNHYGVIDNSYSGNDDQWHMPVYATRDTKINKNDRICQFRINEIQPEINIEVVENLDEVSRSGFGSTGKN